MWKTLTMLLVACIFFFAVPVIVAAGELNHQTISGSTKAAEFWVLKEIEVLEFPGSTLPTTLAPGTITLSMEQKQNGDWGWAEVGQTLNFSYPIQINRNFPGEFIGDAFGGFLWNETELYTSYSAVLTLELEGDVWDFSPECIKNEITNSDAKGPGTNTASLHLNEKCSFDTVWWIDDEATFKFKVSTKLGGKILQSFNLRLKYRKDASLGPFVLFTPRTGTGSGVVTSSPAGINCGDDCSESYAFGSTVTLYAAPDPGSTFTGWSSSGCTGTGSCTVTISRDMTVAADFYKKVGAVSPIISLLLKKPTVIKGLHCSPDDIYDCGLNCVDEDAALEWIGDGFCDDGTYGIDLYCAAFNYDNGDCFIFQ